jgi:pyruvate/2-oxoglutarate dehydrogenase complex dihydrolipoamide acyltransferase (E2) component
VAIIRHLPRERRHTWHFLRFVRTASPVYLDTEVDATELVRHKQSATRAYSVVSYVVLAVGRVMAEYPGANASCAGRVRPRIAAHGSVDVKLTLDKQVRDQRAVVSVVLPEIDCAGIDDVQDTVDRLRGSTCAQIPELRGIRTLQRLPLVIGRLVFALANRLGSRHKWMGTVAVTSLGHQPVLRFFSSGGTALTVGLGQVASRPVVRDGIVCTAPILPVSLTFDHRVLDGALAAEVLAALKNTLETLGVAGTSAAGPVA